MCAAFFFKIPGNKQELSFHIPLAKYDSIFIQQFDTGLYAVQCFDAHDNINNRFCPHIWNSCAADMLNINGDIIQ